MLEHGSFTVEHKERIIFVVLVGCFNEFGSKELTKHLINAVKEQEDQSFAILIDSTDVEGFTPSAYDVLEEYNNWLNSQNLIAKALVSKSPLLHTVNKQRIPSSRKQNFKEFDNKSLALSWLQDELRNSSKNAK